MARLLLFLSVYFCSVKNPFTIAIYFRQVKKRQQRVLMILDSKLIKYEIVDITEPGKEPEKELMQDKATSKGGTIGDPNPRHSLPPQLFYDAKYCGDYDLFDTANELDTLEDFLQLAPSERQTPAVVVEEKKKEEEAEEAAVVAEKTDDADAAAKTENGGDGGDDAAAENGKDDDVAKEV